MFKNTTIKIMLTSFGFGCLFWIIDSIHSFTHFDEHLRYMIFTAPVDFFDSFIFRIPPHDLMDRIFFIICALIAGAYFSKLVSALTRSKQHLEENIIQRDVALIDSQESNIRLESFFDAAFEGIVISKEGQFIDCNKMFAEMFGYEMDELIGKPVTALVHEDDKILVAKNIDENHPYSYEHKAVHKNGSIMYVEVHGGATKFKGEKARITTIHDLTKRKKAERELNLYFNNQRQTSKMEAIGNFAQGIAHDFNNALTPIIGGCEILLYQMPNNMKEHCESQLKNILSAATTASNLVHRIQLFTRKDSQEVLIPLKLYNCVKESFEFLRSMTPTSIEMNMYIERDVNPIMATDVTIRQILMNLVKNAIQAIPFDEGVIDIHIDNEKIMIERFGLSKGNYVRIEVEDNGKGMPSEVLECALDPYFTTKKKGIGSGIGLSVVNSIVQGYGGVVRLYSEEGKGTKVVIYLPSITEEEGMKFNECVIDDIIKGNGESILLIDDENHVIDIVIAILQSLNYKVEAFLSSTDALKEFANRPNDFDVVITDLTMPDMTGIALINEIRGINPEQKIILSSGLGSNGEITNKLFGEKIQGFLTKPVSRIQYAKILTDILT